MAKAGKKRDYCRICGEDKGHSYSGCQNVRGLKEIIKIQDQHEPIRSTNQLLHRLVDSLLAANEALRREK